MWTNVSDEEIIADNDPSKPLKPQYTDLLNASTGLDSDKYANSTGVPITEFRGIEEVSNGPLTRLIRKCLHY